MDKSEKKVVRLKNQKEINELKAKLLVEQGYKCPVTGYKITMSNSALDHDHASGRIRGVLFVGANRMLQEEQWVRFGLRRQNIPAILRKMADYLMQPQLDVLHPTHKPHSKDKA